MGHCRKLDLLNVDIIKELYYTTENILCLICKMAAATAFITTVVAGGALMVVLEGVDLIPEVEVEEVVVGAAPDSH